MTQAAISLDDLEPAGPRVARLLELRAEVHAIATELTSDSAYASLRVHGVGEALDDAIPEVRRHERGRDR